MRLVDIDYTSLPDVPSPFTSQGAPLLKEWSHLTRLECFYSQPLENIPISGLIENVFHLHNNYNMRVAQKAGQIMYELTNTTCEKDIVVAFCKEYPILFCSNYTPDGSVKFMWDTFFRKVELWHRYQLFKKKQQFITNK